MSDIEVRAECVGSADLTQIFLKFFGDELEAFWVAAQERGEFGDSLKPSTQNKIDSDTLDQRGVQLHTS